MVADPTPTCGPPTTDPIEQGDSVTFTCTMQVYYRSDLGARPRAFQDATSGSSIEWEAGSGTQGTQDVSLQVDDSVKLEITLTPDTSGTEIPSFTCTSTFTFTDPGTDPDIDLATNQLQYACTTDQVLLYCTYLLVCRIKQG